MGLTSRSTGRPSAAITCAPSVERTAYSPSSMNIIWRVYGRIAGMSLARKVSPSPMPRMMGLPPFLAATSVSGAVSQSAANA